MKKLILALAVLSLNGCALYDAYFMAKYDNNEYMLINRVRTQANLGASKCGKPEVNAVVENIYATAIELKNYSQSIPHNEDATRLSAELAEIVKGVNDRYKSAEPVSMTYCVTKFGSIERNAVTVQNVLGKKPR